MQQIVQGAPKKTRRFMPLRSILKGSEAAQLHGSAAMTLPLPTDVNPQMLRLRDSFVKPVLISTGWGKPNRLMAKIKITQGEIDVSAQH
ncbi:hypothetical protein [Lysobacter rhizosphaerae]